jgi:hypothetical protein
MDRGSMDVPDLAAIIEGHDLVYVVSPDEPDGPGRCFGTGRCPPGWRWAAARPDTHRAAAIGRVPDTRAVLAFSA